jgi:hypothetical protein
MTTEPIPTTVAELRMVVVKLTDRLRDLEIVVGYQTENNGVYYTARTKAASEAADRIRKVGV